MYQKGKEMTRMCVTNEKKKNYNPAIQRPSYYKDFKVGSFQSNAQTMQQVSRNTAEVKCIKILNFDIRFIQGTVNVAVVNKSFPKLIVAAV